MKSDAHIVVSWYRFYHYDEVAQLRLQTQLNSVADTLQLKGVVIVAPEGMNGSVSLRREDLSKFTSMIRELEGLASVSFRKSFSEAHPFKKFLIKVRPEIVTSEISNVEVSLRHSAYITPAELQAVLHEGERSGSQERKQVVLLDVRNSYETEIGKFRNAVTLPLENFAEFSQSLQAHSIPKDQRLLIYCTGGIRCEKAALVLEQLGYEDVQQLQGGILQYLEEFPNEHFEGECFVFDHRVAVDQERRPTTQYQFCDGCGQPVVKGRGCAACRFAHRAVNPEIPEAF